jgi:hypothetical protein
VVYSGGNATEELASAAYEGGRIRVDAGQNGQYVANLGFFYPGTYKLQLPAPGIM